MLSHHEFISKIQQQLEDWDYQFDRLQARIEDAESDVREEAHRRIDQIRQRRQQFGQQIDELETHAADAVDDIKQGIELAWDGLKTGLQAARSEFDKR